MTHCIVANLILVPKKTVNEFEEDDSRNYEWDSDSFELDYSEQFSLYIDRLDEHSYSNSQCPEDSVLPEIKDILHETLLDFLNSPAEQEANQALENLLEKKNLFNRVVCSSVCKNKGHLQFGNFWRIC